MGKVAKIRVLSGNALFLYSVKQTWRVMRTYWYVQLETSFTGSLSAVMLQQNKINFIAFREKLQPLLQPQIKFVTSAQDKNSLEETAQGRRTVLQQ